MRIAQVAPLYESVPPKLYGGTERVVSYLTEELVRQGHEVTLFASGDSITAAELIAPRPQAVRLDPHCVDSLACHFSMLEELFQHADRFDIIHFHVDYLHYPWSRRERRPQVTTLHGRLDIPELVGLYQKYGDMPVVSISNAQRQPLPHANWQATVYHGLPPDLHCCREQPGDYLVFLGRISPEKRVDRAIEIARRAGMPLRIAAKVDHVDKRYFHDEIEHLFADPLVEYLGELDERRKGELLGGARALLFPIDWPEPFGLVMIEAMACGLPVIAWRRGSVPEVIEDGVTGFIVDGVDQAAEAVARAGHLSRAGCRQAFMERFSVERMARDYVAVYQRLIDRQPRREAVLVSDGPAVEQVLPSPGQNGVAHTLQFPPKPSSLSA
ncbi:MAG: glycosyltransferase family 4 protein [Pirellulales bacterium]